MGRAKKQEDEELSLEQNFARMEEILEQLSGNDIPLEKAFSLYSEGMQVLKNCNGQIDRVEKKVMKLNEEGELEELI